MGHFMFIKFEIVGQKAKSFVIYSYFDNVSINCIFLSCFPDFSRNVIICCIVSYNFAIFPAFILNPVRYSDGICFTLNITLYSCAMGVCFLFFFLHSCVWYTFKILSPSLYYLFLVCDYFSFSRRFTTFLLTWYLVNSFTSSLIICTVW